MADEDSSSGWTRMGSTEAELTESMAELYWLGLEQQLALATISLQNIYRHPPDTQAEAEDRTTNKIAAAMIHWNPSGLNDDEFLDTLRHALELAHEEQNWDWMYRAARSLLVGIGMFDIDKILEYRQPLLTSNTGDVQFEVRIAKEDSREALVEVLIITCQDCEKPIRGSSFACTQGCAEPVAGSDNLETKPCAVRLCIACYPNSKYALDHLRRVAHSPAISPILRQRLDDNALLRVEREIQRVCEKVDQEQDIADGHRLRATVLGSFPKARRLWFPYGNVHACIMFGPLIIENGAPDSKGGARVSLRQPLNFLLPNHPAESSPTLAISPERIIYKNSLPTPRRVVLASMKQVLGGVFSGHLPSWETLENVVIMVLRYYAENYEENLHKSRKYNRKTLDAAAETAAETIIKLLKAALKDELMSYLRLFARRLFRVKLKWNRYTNHCQKFCDNVVDHAVFGTVFPLSTTPAAVTTIGPEQSQPNYLLSFASDKPLDELNKGQFSTGPHGLFFKHIHHELDVIDTVKSHFHNPSTPCQDIYLWPCQSETCSVGEHVWNHPYEFVSVLQLHLLRERDQYLAVGKDHPELMGDDEWIRNRRNILRGLDMFLSSAGAVLRAFRAAAEKGKEENGESTGGAVGRKQWKPGNAHTAGRTGPLGMPGDSFTFNGIDEYPPLWTRMKEKLLPRILPGSWPGIPEGSIVLDRPELREGREPGVPLLTA